MDFNSLITFGNQLIILHYLLTNRITQIPDTYTQFRKSVETQSKIREPVTMPEKLRSLPPIELDHGQVN